MLFIFGRGRAICLTNANRKGFAVGLLLHRIKEKHLLTLVLVECWTEGAGIDDTHDNIEENHQCMRDENKRFQYHICFHAKL